MSLTKNTQKQKETIEIISSETSTQKKGVATTPKKNLPQTKTLYSNVLYPRRKTTSKKIKYQNKR